LHKFHRKKNGACSEPSAAVSGVPHGQGSVLGPLLFPNLIWHHHRNPFIIRLLHGHN